MCTVQLHFAFVLTVWRLAEPSILGKSYTRVVVGRVFPMRIFFWFAARSIANFGSHAMPDTTCYFSSARVFGIGFLPGYINGKKIHVGTEHYLYYAPLLS